MSVRFIGGLGICFYCENSPKHKLTAISSLYLFLSEVIIEFQQVFSKSKSNLSLKQDKAIDYEEIVSNKVVGVILWLNMFLNMKTVQIATKFRLAFLRTRYICHRFNSVISKKHSRIICRVLNFLSKWYVLKSSKIIIMQNKCQKAMGKNHTFYFFHFVHFFFWYV